MYRKCLTDLFRPDPGNGDMNKVTPVTLILLLLMVVVVAMMMMMIVLFTMMTFFWSLSRVLFIFRKVLSKEEGFWNGNLPINFGLEDNRFTIEYNRVMCDWVSVALILGYKNWKAAAVYVGKCVSLEFARQTECIIRVNKFKKWGLCGVKSKRFGAGGFFILFIFLKGKFLKFWNVTFCSD